MTELKSAQETVERAIRGFGVDPTAARSEADAGAEREISYRLMRGSALTVVTLRTEKGEVLLRVACPVMTLPPEAKRAAFFQRLLELNASAVVGGAAFGLVADRIVVVSERPAAGLDEAEATHLIKRASAVADTFDDRLVSEFGGQHASRA